MSTHARNGSPSTSLRTLIVASDADLRRQLAGVVIERGGSASETDGVARAWERLSAPFDLVVLVASDANGDVEEFVADLRTFDDDIMALTVVDSTESGRLALLDGAFDFFVAPVDRERFAAVLEHVRERAWLRKRDAVLERLLDGGARVGALLTRNPRMLEIVVDVMRLARYRTPVLVVGERGTEHEEVARALHDIGRPDAPFVATAASAVTVAELRSLTASAANGTLFIDDLGAIAADVAAALTALVEDALGRVEGSAPRVVAGHPQPLPPTAAPDDPRGDLYARFQPATLILPPLRERREDIVLVARELAAGVGRDRGRDLHVARGAEDALMAYDWPGNVDELKSVVVTAAAAANGPAIETYDLPAPLAERGEAVHAGGFRRLRDLEVQHLRQVLEETRGNKSRAARILGLSRWALQRKLRKHGISLDG